MYDIIVTGATFFAAGIAEKFGKKCLVIERRQVAGYEFFDAFNFGCNYDIAPKSSEAAELKNEFIKPDNFYNRQTYIYKYFKKCDIWFASWISSVKKDGDVFLCTVHTVDGYKTVKAKMVIDTSANDKFSESKTYNLLIESKQEPKLLNADVKKVKGDGRYVLCLPVSKDCTYIQARCMAYDVVSQFKRSEKLILSANEFDYKIKPCLEILENECLHMASKGYDNPILAFDAGINFEREANL